MLEDIFEIEPCSQNEKDSVTITVKYEKLNKEKKEQLQFILKAMMESDVYINKSQTYHIEEQGADKIEIITNPSARYDASGGNAGILNIILKKNKKVGYNGGLSAGVDSRGKINAVGDINLRQNKLNFFLSGNYN